MGLFIMFNKEMGYVAINCLIDRVVLSIRRKTAEQAKLNMFWSSNSFEEPSAALYLLLTFIMQSV